MIPYFILMAVLIRVFIGFQTGSLDWILPWYGCLPENKKKNIDGKKILDFSSAMTLISLNGSFVMLYSEITDSNTFMNLGRYLVVVPLICIIYFTFKWSRNANK